ncbi:MAG: helix-turn-helix transcriptional regulator [Lachnospiraceae bacterium]|nr:helix-turn-helix transcriptional regulator [Lachnospiraceae bacterium]
MITFSPLYKTLARKGMKLKDLAEKMGITYIGLHQLLTYPNTKVSQVERICNVLKCGIEEVIEDDGQYETGWESILDGIAERRCSDDHAVEPYIQTHPWLKGIDAKSARKILFPS